MTCDYRIKEQNFLPEYIPVQTRLLKQNSRYPHNPKYITAQIMYSIGLKTFDPRRLVMFSFGSSVYFKEMQISRLLVHLKHNITIPNKPDCQFSTTSEFFPQQE